MTTAWRYATEKIVLGLCLLSALLVVGALFLIIGQVFIAGLPSLTWYFVTTPENATAGLGHGIANAIVGTILISFCATIVAGPFGFGTAIYMKRYAPDNGMTRSFRFLLEVLSGTPSIVVGIFAFLIFVIYLKPFTGGYSLIAGTVALAILIMPVIERAIEDAIDRVSPELEEGSYALGANKWQTIRGITIPTSFSGMLTGFTLGFGRAAEESAIVLLTAGYTQYMPEIGIQSSNGLLSGMKVYPLQDQVGTLPYVIYHAALNSAQINPSSGFAAAFVLIMIVFTINISGKAFLSYGFGGGKKSDGSFLGSIKKRLFPSPATGPAAIDHETNQKQSSTITDKDHIAEKIIKNELSIGSFTITPRKKASNENSDDTMTPQAPPGVPVKSAVLVPQSDLFEGQSMDPQLPGDEETVPAVHLNDGPGVPPPEKKRASSFGASITQISTMLRNRMRTPVLNNRKKSAPENTVADRINVDSTGNMTKQPSVMSRLTGSIRPFLLTLAPFALVAAILTVLTIIMPGFSPGGSGGPAGLLTVLLIAIVLCAIGTLGSLFLLKQGKIRMRNRRARLVAIALGIGLIFIAACLFTGHLFAPATSSPDSNSPAAPGLFGFLQPSGSTATNTSDRNARLAAFLASEGGGDTGSSSGSASAAPLASTVTQTPVPAAPPANSVVPVKNALDLGESYWYGDNSRPCLATVYNVTVFPFYFYWDMDWNRFVQVTPVSSGDTFLVVFIRIEDTGNMSAIVPPATSFVVSYDGQTYANNPYFDTSVLDQNEINIYTADFNALPYQWIREIGQQKRDYAFLTGYNIFGQNQTIISNFTTNSAYSPPTPPDTNGEGYFIKPGRSNAIDGYLIYEVPAAAGADLKDTYVQVSFNSFSPTQWRLGK
jgi:phosphate transport system permease protein